MGLEELKKLVEDVKGLTEDLLDQNAKAEEILGKYKEKFNDVEDIEKGLVKIKKDLQNVQEQATDKLVIEFVGAVNSGKSSLINALLREDRLPTSCCESTVCSFKIVITEEEKWSLQLDGETKKKDGETEKKDGETEKKDGETETKDGETEKKDGETEKKDGETEKKDGETETKDGETETKDGETETKDGETETKDGEIETKDGETEKKDGETEKKDGETAKKDGETAKKDGETEKKYGEEFKEIIKACTKMSSPECRDLREKLNITAKSVIQLNWPKCKCNKLPENIVLYDTPGFGEDSMVFEVLKKSCKTADIIVAVMRTKTPSLEKIAELVKEAKTEKDGDKCIFGVYTKWDKFEKKQKKTKAGNFPVDVKYLREHHNQKFLEKVCEKKKTAAKAEEDEEEEDEEEKVFFVDVGCEETFNEKAGTEGTEGFLKFEERLVESAKELMVKRTLINEKANSVELEFEEVFEKFKSIIDGRGKEKKEERDEIATLKEELESFTTIRESVKSPAQIMDTFLTKDEIMQLVEKFDGIVKKHDKEEDALKEFTDVVNAKIEAAEDIETTKLNREYERWKNNLKSKTLRSIHLPESLPGYNLKKLESQKELPKELYNEFLDSHTYITSKVLLGSLAFGVGGAAAAAAPGQLLGISARAAFGFAGGGFAAGGLTDAMSKKVSDIFYGNKIMSPKKIDCWKGNFSGKLRNLQQGNSKDSQPLRKETDSIFNKISPEAKKLRELTKLTEEVKHLSQWSKEFKKIIFDLNKIKEKFQQLQATSQNPRGASEDHTENQSTIAASSSSSS